MSRTGLAEARASLGQLPDEGVRKVRFREGALKDAKVDVHLLRFAARSIELDAENKTVTRSWLRAALAKPLTAAEFLGPEVSAKELISVVRRAAKAAGVEASALQVDLDGVALPLSMVEHDLDASWKKTFRRGGPSGAGPLGAGTAFKPRIERTQELVVGLDPKTRVAIHPDDVARLGTLSDDAIRKVHITKTSLLERPDVDETGPGLLRFMARSIEIDGPQASACERGLAAYFRQPITEESWRRVGAQPVEMIATLIRAARAIGLKPEAVKIHVNEHSAPVPLSEVESFLANRPAPYIHEYTGEERFVYPHGEVGEGGPMLYDYGYTAPRETYGSVSGPGGPGIRLAPAPPPYVSPGRPYVLSPAPPPFTSPPRPPLVVLQPPPPPHTSPAIERPSPRTYINPWEILGSGQARDFFEAKHAGFRGDWHDWLEKQ